jgi:hypothetical protein
VSARERLISSSTPESSVAVWSREFPEIDAIPGNLFEAFGGTLIAHVTSIKSVEVQRFRMRSFI